MHASPHARGDRYGRHSNYAARPAQPNVETLRRPAAAASQLAAKPTDLPYILRELRARQGFAATICARAVLASLRAW